MSYIDYDKIAEEAARRYPIGTEYIPLSLNGISVEGDRIKKARHFPHWVCKVNQNNDEPDALDVGYGYIYINGIWADVIDDNGNLIVYNSNLNIEPSYEVY